MVCRNTRCNPKSQRQSAIFCGTDALAAGKFSNPRMACRQVFHSSFWIAGNRSQNWNEAAADRRNFTDHSNSSSSFGYFVCITRGIWHYSIWEYSHVENNHGTLGLQILAENSWSLRGWFDKANSRLWSTWTYFPPRSICFPRWAYRDSKWFIKNWSFSARRQSSWPLWSRCQFEMDWCKSNVSWQRSALLQKWHLAPRNRCSQGRWWNHDTPSIRFYESHAWTIANVTASCHELHHRSKHRHHADYLPWKSWFKTSMVEIVLFDRNASMGFPTWTANQLSAHWWFTLAIAVSTKRTKAGHTHQVVA